MHIVSITIRLRLRPGTSETISTGEGCHLLSIVTISGFFYIGGDAMYFRSIIAGKFAHSHGT